MRSGLFTRTFIAAGFVLALGMDESLSPLNDAEIDEAVGSERANWCSPEHFAALFGEFLAPVGRLGLCSCFSDVEPLALGKGGVNQRKRLTQALADALGGQRTVEGYEGMVTWTEAPMVNGEKDYRPPEGVRKTRTPNPSPEEIPPSYAHRAPAITALSSESGMARALESTPGLQVFDALGRRQFRISSPGVYFLRWLIGPVVHGRKVIFVP